MSLSEGATGGDDMMVSEPARWRWGNSKRREARKLPTEPQILETSYLIVQPPRV